MGQVWYLIVSFPDICRISYFHSNCFRDEISLVHLKFAAGVISRQYFMDRHILNKKVEEIVFEGL